MLRLPSGWITLFPRQGALAASFNQSAILLRRRVTVYTPIQVCRQQRSIRVISGGVDNHLAPAHSFLRFPSLGIVLVPGPGALGAAVDLSAFSEREVGAVFTPFNVGHVGNGRGQSWWLVLVSAAGSAGISTSELGVR